MEVLAALVQYLRYGRTAGYKMRRLIFWATTHVAALAVGFALGIYVLPILTAPDAPDAKKLQETAQGALFTAEFTRELRGSDFLHWGEGRVRWSHFVGQLGGLVKVYSAH